MDSLEASLDPTPSVEFAMLADAVQAVGGKLYILGGGWELLYVASFPARHPSIGVGIRLRVPWPFADSFKLSVDLMDEDGRSLLGSSRFSRTIQVRPPVKRLPGAEMGMTRAFTFNNLVFPKPGGYSFAIYVEDEQVSRIPFRVLERALRAPRAGAS
ncbi:DUF6941 family protein [Candidatus Spongiisocius sp.]|uniref:DUF6941 family protein n=1 Tax=Candidatus Spongiisocius sp. TaxID=3101273 RepID=UPI003B5C7F99